MQHHVGRVLALGDLEHAAGHRAAAIAVGGGFQLAGKAVELRVAPLAGALQQLAMSTRPTVAVAVAALVLGGVPVSAAVALHLLGQVAGTVLQQVS